MTTINHLGRLGLVGGDFRLLWSAEAFRGSIDFWDTVRSVPLLQRREFLRLHPDPEAAQASRMVTYDALPLDFVHSRLGNRPILLSSRKNVVDGVHQLMGDRHRRALLRIDRLDAAVGSRTNEIGLRMALGADRSSVVALILKWALVLIAFGLVLGVP